jgi:hypothetical protein
MPLEVMDRVIRTVLIVDDQEEARDSYEYSVIDAQLAPISEPGPLPSIEDFQGRLRGQADSLLCDYKLRVKNYARFDGAELVARCYDQKFPAILCTRYEDALFDDIRRYREKIPVLLDPDSLHPETLVKALTEVITELANGPGPRRRPWRAQVHVLDVDEPSGIVYVDLPGWHSSSVVRLRLDQIPSGIRSQLTPGFRCYAKVNLGAENTDELYFKDWEQR